MLFSKRKSTGLMAGAVISVFFVASAPASYAQSATTSASDDAYLSALTTMATDMDLNGLAGQTFAPVTVTAPQLPDMAAKAGVVSCDVLLAQAAASGRAIEVFGDQTEISQDEPAALSKCMLAETGVLVSYLIPES